MRGVEVVAGWMNYDECYVREGYGNLGNIVWDKEARPTAQRIQPCPRVIKISSAGPLSVPLRDLLLPCVIYLLFFNV